MRSYLSRLALVVVVSGCSDSIDHNQVLAAKRAMEFAQVAFVEQDIPSAHARLSDAAQRYVSVDNIRDTLSRLHPNGYPSRVVATEYQLIPTETKALYIYLFGEGSGQTYSYRLTMERTRASDYKVSAFDVGYGLRYSGSPLRKTLKK